MSRDLGRDVPDLEKLYARKLWADFSYPIVGACATPTTVLPPHQNFLRRTPSETAFWWSLNMVSKEPSLRGFAPQYVVRAPLSCTV